MSFDPQPFRQQYRAAIRPGYNPWLHAGFVLAYGGAWIVFFLSRLEQPSLLEWLTVPQAFITTAGSLSQARDLLDGLEVDTDRMRANLDITNGILRVVCDRYLLPCHLVGEESKLLGTHRCHREAERHEDCRE